MNSHSTRIAKLSPAKRALLDERLESRRGVVTPIAVIGLGCRFPGAPNPDAFWQLLRDGGDAISEVPEDRWNVDAFYDPDPAMPGKMSTRWGGFLGGVDGFDPEFFGISPREAARMDPQQRLLLQVAWEALEDAGQVAERLAGSATGVFVGIATNDYGAMQLTDIPRIDGHAGTGSAMSIAANRLSYFFDFRGPSMAVDTACSSSLVAVHLACQSLWSGESTLALAGGVNLILTPGIAINFTKAGAMAPDGRCKAFDSRANGYVRGEGAGIVVLKPLSAALTDGDPVHAVIRGSAVNQDGRTNGLMAPNRYSQEAVLREAYGRARVSPGEVQYVEAHGTGTLLGDPIEAGALGVVLAAGRPAEQRCLLGAVKTNIGHLEAAAGIAGLIKVVLSLRRRQIPPSLHFLQPNPHIPFETLPLRLANQLEPWPSYGETALAGVSSFGFGGTNAHVVLEGAPPSESEAEPADQAELLPLSARAPQALREIAQRYRDSLAAPSPECWRDVCATSALRRSHHDQRLALVAQSREEACERLDAFLAQEPCAGIFTNSKAVSKRKLVFVFSGQGSQWHGMGRQLLEEQPVFRSTIERCDEIMRELAGWSVLEVLRAETSIEGIDIIQPVLFAMQVALGEMWRSWGIQPDAAVGHSMGEVAAANFAGAITLRDALQVVWWRSHRMKRISGFGAMAVIELSLDRVEQALQGFEDRLSVAASNSPVSTVVSGDPAALDQVMTALQADGVFCRLVKVDVAAHSPQLEPLRGEVLEGLRGVSSSPPSIPFYSTVRSGNQDNLDAEYWWRNMRDPVRFSEAVDRLIETGHHLFLEVSPHPILVAAILDSLRAHGAEGAALWSLRRDADERAMLLGSLGSLYAAAWPIDWRKVYPKPSRHVRLPSYPWQQERYWLETSSSAGLSRSAMARSADPDEGAHPLLGRKLNLADAPQDHRWECTMGKDTIPAFVLDHKVQNVAVVPGAGYVEMALAAARESIGSGPIVLDDVQFHRAFFLPEGVTRRVQTVLSTLGTGERRFRVYSRPCDGDQGDGSWVLHAEGRLATTNDPRPARQAGSLDEIRARLGEAIDGADFYTQARSLGNHYGPAHQGIERMWRGEGEVLAEVRAPGGVEHNLKTYETHPALLDAAWQALGGLLLASPPGESKRGATVPVHIDRLTVWGRPGSRVWSHAFLRTGGGSEEYAGDIDLLDESGGLVVETSGLRLRPLDLSAEVGPDTESDAWLYEMQWRASTRSELKRSRPVSPKLATWLVLADSGGVAEQLAQRLIDQGNTPVLVRPSGAFEQFSGVRFGVRPGSPEDLMQVIDSVFGDSANTCRGVLYLWGIDLPFAAQMETPVLEHATTTCDSALNLLRATAQMQTRTAPLWIVTRGAQPVQGPVQLSLSQAPLWGLGRAIAQEHPARWGGLIDLDPAATPEDSAAAIHSEIDGAEKEDQIAFRDGTRYILRLQRKDRSARRRNLRFRPEASYLITGGLGDLGLTVARWMTEQGARHLILLSRTALPPREQWGSAEAGSRLAQQTLALQEIEAGAEVRLASVDVADVGQLSSFLAQYRQDGSPPIRGVIHAAGIVELKPLTETDSAALEAILRPKVAGAWLLHHLLREDNLDFFVMFSSFASLLGSPQLGAYAAANSFLDALAFHRRSENRPALAANWAVWGGVGMAARYLQGGHALARGVESFSPAQGLAVLGRLMTQHSPQAGVMRVDWGVWSKLYPAFSTAPVISELIREETNSTGQRNARPAEPIRQLILAAEPGKRREMMESYLHRQTARVLGLAASRLDPQRSLTTLGFDSLMAVELRNRVETDLEVTLPLVELLQGPTTVQLSGMLLEQVTASFVFSPDWARTDAQAADGDWESMTL